MDIGQKCDMNQTIRTELWQLLIALGLLSIISLFLFSSDIWSAFTQSIFYEQLSTHFLAIIFEVFLIYLFFKIAYFIIVSIIFTRLGSFFVSKEKLLKFSKLIRFSWWTIFCITLFLMFLGDNLNAFFTSLGLVGLGLTVALQKPIMNMVGWLTIVFKDVYSEGDRVNIGGVRGDVRHIHLMNTEIDGLLESADQHSNKVITVPNEFVLIKDVENYTKNSNYVREELKIRITYESDYSHAMQILERTVRKIITRNINKYIKKRSADKLELQKLLNSFVKSKKERRSIEEQEDTIEREIKQLQELSEEFTPKIRLEASESGLHLIVHFLTPYNTINATRTDIVRGFLDAIANESAVQIAYPHMQLVNFPVQKKIKRKLPKKDVQNIVSHIVKSQ